MKTPTNIEFGRAWYHVDYAWRWPAFWVSRELREEAPQWFAHEPWWYTCTYYSYDRDCYFYTLTPLAPFVGAWLWWKHSYYRFCVERAMRGRIADKPVGDLWTSWTWKLRHPRAWTWKRTNLQLRKPVRRQRV